MSRPLLKPNLADVVKRIDQRLQELELSERAASLMAHGSADLIRNMRRKAEQGRQFSTTMGSLKLLAKPLKTTANWLASGTDEKDQSNWIDARRFSRPMSAEDMREWRRKVAKLYPDKPTVDGMLNERDSAQLLGLSRGALRSSEKMGAPLYIALACAAILAGIRPYGSRRKNGE